MRLDAIKTDFNRTILKFQNKNTQWKDKAISVTSILQFSVFNFPGIIGLKMTQCIVAKFPL